MRLPRLHFLLVGFAFLCAVSVRASAPSGEAEKVRAVLTSWQQAVERQDVDSVLATYSDSFVVAGRPGPVGRDQLRTMTESLLTGRFRPAMFSVSDAQISVTDSTAVAEPVLFTQSWATVAMRFAFRKEPAGWRIISTAPQGLLPIERGLPGLGRDYLDLAERWASANLTWVQQTLHANPPNGGDPFMREQALLTLDEPLHLRSAPQLAPVQRFLRTNIDRAIGEMRSEKVTEGATIWKLYNHGWVVRTPNHTWAHDFYPGTGDASMTDEQVDAILGQAEALFCSHWHGDHTSMPVIKRALEKGLSVFVGPLPEEEWAERARTSVRELADSLGAGERLTFVALGDSGRLGDIRYYAYPGHQGELPNCAFVITADGMNFMQTGDQSNSDDFAWIDRVGDERTIDVFMPNVWTDQFDRVIKGVRPRVVIPGHENELGHNFEHREPYAQALERLEGQSCQWYVLAWGERVHIEPR